MPPPNTTINQTPSYMMQILLHHPLTDQQLQELQTLLHEFLPPDRVTITQNGELLHPTPQPNAELTDNCFFLKCKDRHIKVAVANILWVEGSGSGVKIVTESSAIMGMVNMQNFLKQVKHPSLLRIHKSYVINTCKLAAFDAGAVYLTYNNGQEKVIPIGATYREEFKRQMPRLTSD